MAGIIFLQVILRYVFKAPLSWPEEMARYFLVWISCFGSAYAVREGLHISVTFIKNKFPEKIRSYVAIVIHFLVVSFFSFCVIEGFKLSFSQWIELSAALRLPMTFPTIAIPVGFAIMILFTVERLLLDLKEIRSGKSV
jgi:TRAP-type C4-dicarboxylate transport system permease small subunit